MSCIKSNHQDVLLLSQLVAPPGAEYTLLIVRLSCKLMALDGTALNTHYFNDCQDAPQIDGIRVYTSLLSKTDAIKDLFVGIHWLLYF